MNGIELSIGPVAYEECVLVFGGKLGPVSETNAGRRSWSHVDDRSKGIATKIHEFSGSGAPTEVRAVDHVVDPGRAVPGGIHVPLHVRVISE